MPIFSFRSTNRARAGRLSPLIATLILLSTSAIVIAQDARRIGERDAVGPAPVADSVEPIGEWVRLTDIIWREEQIGIHIRTGYARPIVFPEPVRLAEPVTLPFCDIELEADVVSFSPRRHFLAQVVRFVGEESGRIYSFRIRSSEEGKRVPIRMVLP